VIENSETEAVPLCMIDKHANVDALAAVCNARTDQQRRAAICTVYITRTSHVIKKNSTAVK